MYDILPSTIVDVFKLQKQLLTDSYDFNEISDLLRLKPKISLKVIASMIRKDNIMIVPLIEELFDD